MPSFKWKHHWPQSGDAGRYALNARTTETAHLTLRLQKPKKQMTIRGVGKPVPSQLYLMQLAGLVVEGFGRVNEPTLKQVQASRRTGHQGLCNMTGQDFGDDVEKWYDYLIVNDYGLTHSYGYGALRRFLLQQGFAAPYKKEVLAKKA